MSLVDKESLRVTHLQDYENLKDKRRHGFFSVPITTAVGDDGPFKTKIRILYLTLDPRNEMGKP